MANSPDFVAHALDLLSGLGPVSARAMFGGHGIYLGGLMFALLDDDELFLKADEASRPRFEAAGCRQWVYPSLKGPMSMGYWRPPDEAHEEAEAMLPWARLGLEAALKKAANKADRGRQRAGRPATARSAARKSAPARPPRKPASAKPPRKPPGGGARAARRPQSRRK